MLLSEKHKNEFKRLACELSPENLTCDGELSGEPLRRKTERLQQRWRELEVRCGYTVTTYDVWKF